MLIKKNSITLLTLLLIFTISACAKTDKIMLQKDISRYSAIEEELNIKIKLINTQMTSTIAKYKRTNDFTQFELDNKQINDELLRLLQLAKEENIYISSKEMKNYHKITVKLIEIQAEYVKVTIEQFKTLGEHGNNDAKSTQLKYNRKIRALQKQQDKLLEEIIEKIYEK